MISYLFAITFLVLCAWFLFLWHTGDKTSLQPFGYCLLVFLILFAIYAVS